MKVDCSNIKHVNIHKQQFDSIEKNADYIILGCVEDGRCIVLKRENRLCTMTEDKDGE